MRQQVRSIRVVGIAALIALNLSIGVASQSYAYDEKTDSQNMVWVAVKPVQLAPGKPAKFRVRMNTHSVDLGQDMTKSAVLNDGSGAKLDPTAWKGAAPGGHHRTGYLIFPALSSNAILVKLTIKGVGGVNRVYQWKLSGQ